MNNILVIVTGLTFLVTFSVGIGMSLDTQRQRTARRELAGERRRRSTTSEGWSPRSASAQPGEGLPHIASKGAAPADTARLVA